MSVSKMTFWCNSILIGALCMGAATSRQYGWPIKSWQIEKTITAGESKLSASCIIDGESLYVDNLGVRRRAFVYACARHEKIYSARIRGEELQIMVLRDGREVWLKRKDARDYQRIVHRFPALRNSKAETILEFRAQW